MELKSRLSSTPILGHPKYDRPFILHTDASKDGFGAVLSQLWNADDYRLDTPETPDTDMPGMPGMPDTPGTRETDIRHAANHELDTPETPDTDTPGMPGTPDTSGTRRTDMCHNDADNYKDGTMTTLATLTEDSGWPHAYRCDPAFGSVYRALEAGVPNDPGFSLNPDGMLLFHTTRGDRICLPVNKLRETLHTAHDVLGVKILFLLVRGLDR